MLNSLKKSFDLYRTNRDPFLERLAKTIESNIAQFRIYVDYAVTSDESFRLLSHWLRITGNLSSGMKFGYDHAPLLEAQHPENYIGQWFIQCTKARKHSLKSTAEYLKLPLTRLQGYKSFLFRLSALSDNIDQAFRAIDGLCQEIEEQKPIAAEQRRMAEFDRIYSSSEGSIVKPHRKYLADAVVAIGNEVSFQNKGKRIPDVIHYEQHQEIESSNSDTLTLSPTTTSGSSTFSMANPVPKIVHTKTYLSQASMPRRRLIVCDDVVIVTDEETKKVIRFVDRKQLIATMAWGKNLSDPFDNAEQQSVWSESSTGSNTVQIGVSSSPSVRLQFKDSVDIWHCAVRIINGGRSVNAADPRHKLLSVLSIE